MALELTFFPSRLIANTVEKVIRDNPELGYRNRSEFIVEAIREKVVRTMGFSRD